jgi:hypothetical protein
MEEMTTVNKIADAIGAVIVVAGIMVLTRPGSKGPDLVKNLTDGFAKVLGAATGGGTWGR